MGKFSKFKLMGWMVENKNKKYHGSCYRNDLEKIEKIRPVENR